MKIGKWNVRSLLWPGVLEVLHNELSNRDFGVVALQEIWLESGNKKFDNLTIFNSGLENKKHEFGWRFYVKGEFLKYVKDFIIMNERLCWLRLKAKRFSCTLINVNTPTNEKMEKTKEEFYNLLEQITVYIKYLVHTSK
jgi:plasmid rolling circle replication initiator protein Rep